MKRLTAKKQLVLEFIFCSLPLIYYLLCLPGMPETVPVHWNAGGTADRFAPRFSFDMLLISAVGYVGLLIGVGLRKLICSISTQERAENRATVEGIMRWTEAAECLLFTGIALHGVIRTCSGESTDNGFIMKLGAAVVALVLFAAGNQLPKLRRNSVSGARTKYSLSSDEAWYKTQRYVGRALMLAGAGLLIVTLMPFITAGMACAATLAALVVVCAAALNYRG